MQQTNCIGLRGVGLAAQITLVYPYGNPYSRRVPQRPRSTVCDAASRSLPGTIVVCHARNSDKPKSEVQETTIELVEVAAGTGPVVINCMAQKNPGRPRSGDDRAMRLVWMQTCLQKVARIPGLKSLGIPYYCGCGLAGGLWPDYYGLFTDFARANPRVAVTIVKAALFPFIPPVFPPIRDRLLLLDDEGEAYALARDSPGAVTSPFGTHTFSVLLVGVGRQAVGDIESRLRDLLRQSSQILNKEFILEAVVVDTAQEACMDLWDPQLRAQLLNDVRSGSYHFVFLSPPYWSWSRYRFQDMVSGEPLRTLGNPWGWGMQKEVSYNHHAKLTLDSMLTVFALDVATLAREVAGCSLILEHPEDWGSSMHGEPGSLWQLSALRSLSPAFTRGAFFSCDVPGSRSMAYARTECLPIGVLTNVPRVLESSKFFCGWPEFQVGRTHLHLDPRSRVYHGPLPVSCPCQAHPTEKWPRDRPMRSAAVSQWYAEGVVDKWLQDMPDLPRKTYSLPQSCVTLPVAACDTGGPHGGKVQRSRDEDLGKAWLGNTLFGAHTVMPSDKLAVYDGLQVTIEDGDRILEKLRSIPWRASARYNVKGFGYCIGASSCTRGPYITKMSDDMIELCKLINRILGALINDDTFKWSSIQINKNTISDWHRDKGNLGLSAIALFGEFKKGELILHLVPKISFSKRNTFLFFDGHVPHESKPFTGPERYSIVLFYHSTCNMLSDKNRQFLADIGFRLPSLTDRYPIMSVLSWSINATVDFLPTACIVDPGSESETGSDGSYPNNALYNRAKSPIYDRVIILLTDKNNHALARHTSGSRGCATYVFPTASVLKLNIRSVTRVLRRTNVLFVVDLFNCACTTEETKTLASVVDGFVSHVDFHKGRKDWIRILDKDVDRQEGIDIHACLALQR